MYPRETTVMVVRVLKKPGIYEKVCMYGRHDHRFFSTCRG